MIHCLKTTIENLLPNAPKDIRLKRYVAQVTGAVLCACVCLNVCIRPVCPHALCVWCV